jgi:hypothetical protein
MKDNVKGIQTIQWFHFDKKQALQISLKRHWTKKCLAETLKNRWLSKASNT